MKKKTSWSPPGWPWELELLALVFVITAIAIPVYLQYIQPEDLEEASLLTRVEAARMQNQGTWQDFTQFFWAVAIVGLYVAHLTTASASSDFISTPFTHLFSPLLFSMITYYRLFKLGQSIQVVTGKPGEIAIWVVGVLTITFLVARLRMRRHLLAFRDVDWDITTPTLFDSTYFELLAYFRPLVYPPRTYRACSDGILIEGWLYVMPIPFDVINNVDPVRRAHLMSSGYYLATSSKSLVRILLAEHSEPLFISPLDREQFILYCDEKLAPKRTGTHHGDRTATARRTRAGQTSSRDSSPGTTTNS